MQSLVQASQLLRSSAVAHCSGATSHRSFQAPLARLPHQQLKASCLGTSVLSRPSSVKSPVTGRRFHTVTNSVTYGTEPATHLEAYITVGLSQCFEKDDDGKLKGRLVIEPITPNALECMAVGGKTSFMHVFGITLKDALQKDKSILPTEFAEGMFCENFEYKATCVARTWMRDHPQDNLLDIVPLGAIRSNFNFNIENKRVLNFENIVNDDDNIKQDISIDVYGRKTAEEAQAAAAEAQAKAEAAKSSSHTPAAKGEESDDNDLESLLAA